MYLMANDTKWVKVEKQLSFVPYPGMNFDGLAGEQSLKISGMSYDTNSGSFKIRLAWLSQDPMMSADMLSLGIGWTLVEEGEE